MSALVSTRKRSAGNPFTPERDAQPSWSDRALMMMMVAKDIAALIAVVLFVLAVSLWGSGIEDMILTARGQ